jgi:hypothetical protein
MRAPRESGSTQTLDSTFPNPNRNILPTRREILATSFTRKFRNRPTTLDPTQPKRPGLLARDDPFRLQIELHGLRPPSCPRSARE